MTTGKYVTAAGLKVPSVEDILADVSEDERAAIDPLLNTDPDSPTGQLNGPFASQTREVWEVVDLAFNGMNPDAAEDALLDHLCALTGTRRAGATKSKFRGKRKLTINLNAATVVDIGAATFHVDGQPTIRFVNTEKVTAGLAGDYKISAEAENTGPIHANANTLKVIATPVVGLNSVINTYDPELGTDVDKDPQLRIRREQELRATGAANPDAIQADLLAIDVDGDRPVLTATVLSNDTDFWDPVTGLPPHSLEALVFDGLIPGVPNDTIAQTLWDSKAGGIKTVGNTSGIAEDKNGDKHTVPFSRPVIREIKFSIGLSVDVNTYAGDPAVKETVVATFLANMTRSGKLLVCNEYVASLMDLSGVKDVTNIQIGRNGLAFPPAGQNYQLGIREIGTTQTSWVTVVVT